MSFSVQEREKNVEKMGREIFDLAIIGGGITGAGVARDAASRGMKVALIEANDFAFGTSSRSSKLVHGGIRYLENMEFGLVFEALSERRRLFEMAPHLVHPLRFLFPLYDDSRFSMGLIGMGMWLYDALALFESPEMHERLSPHATVERLPFLKEKGLQGAYAYSDAYMDDDRLTIETLRSAASYGAVCANYVRATGARFEADQMCAVLAEDTVKKTKFEIRARHFVSTVGPWTDLVGKELLGTWRNLMRPSKGIHLTLPRERVPVSSAVVMGADSQKRIIFLIPRHEMVIVGTTDTDFPGNPADVSTHPEDVKYLLSILREYFPGANLVEEDVISSYSGVRPLVHDDSMSESGTSREHLILHDPRNVTFVTGGKYTTYRHMSQQTVDAVLGFFPVSDQARFARSRTKEPLNPLVDQESYWARERMVSQLSSDSGINPRLVAEWLERHGREGESLMEIFAQLPDHFSDATKYWQAEAIFAVRNTMCMHLADFFLRRSPLFLATPKNGSQFMPGVLDAMASLLGWNDARRQEEKGKLIAHARRELAWKNSTSPFE